MKKETKEVVTVQEVYIANDGTEFDNCNDCIRHEEFVAEKVALQELLEQSRVVDITKELYWFSLKDWEKAWLAHLESPKDLPCVAYAISRTYNNDRENRMNNLLGALEYNLKGESYPMNIAVYDTNDELYVNFQGHIDDIMGNVESLKTKVEQLKTFGVA